MKLWRSARWLGAVLVAVAIAAVLAWTFRAYQNPANVAQWLSLLQLCR